MKRDRRPNPANQQRHIGGHAESTCDQRTACGGDLFLSQPIRQEAGTVLEFDNAFVVIGDGELHERIKAIANKRAAESSCFGGQ